MRHGYNGTREDRRNREVRLLNDRLARHERNAAAHEPHTSVARMAAHAADAVRAKLEQLGQAHTRTAYLRG